ncbi:MAG: hypothetical protein RL757_966 [Bacteroidota bacterium]|jgi:hypothetical protein
MEEKDNQVHLEDLRQIRQIMERSSRFISLSGLSGVAVGVCALVCATVAYLYIGVKPFQHERPFYLELLQTYKWGLHYETFTFLLAFPTAILATALGIYFAARKAKSKGLSVWTPQALRVLVNLAIPLAAGALFCLAMWRHGILAFVIPCTLIFYGLALVNVSRYTLQDVRYLGFLQIILGIIGAFEPFYGMELWTIGFGLLHIIYGVLMYNKYEKTDN